MQAFQWRADTRTAGKPNRRQLPIPLTVNRPELIVNGSDREFRELVHNLFGFFALHECVRNGHAKFIGLDRH